MRLPLFFIDRPIFAVVLSLLVCLLGLAALGRLPVSEYPDVVPPSIVVVAQYPGAAPETIASTVAGPLEQQMTGLPHLLYMGSQSTPSGVMQLTLTFHLGTDLDRVLTEVQNRIQRASPRLPEEVRRLGVFAEKRSPDMLMVIGISVPEQGASALELANFCRLRLRDELLRVPGVGEAQVYGAGQYAMRVWLDPERMAARAITPGEVVAAIREQNLQIASGALGAPPAPPGTAFELAVVSRDRLATPEQFADIVVRRTPEGRLVRLGEVARVELGADEESVIGMIDNRRAVLIPVIQQPGSNALAVAAEVRRTLERLAPTLPAGARLEVLYDPTAFVRDSIAEVVRTLGEAVLLVAAVVLLFLKSWRAALIPLAAVPVSVIGTFAVMQAAGFSINTLTLFGLVLSIGIVVDDAIVVVENCERHLAMGKTPRQAARDAMREVAGPIVAITLVLASVFIPTALIGGLTGRFYQQFALTIAISTVLSAFNSLTLSPALAALLLRHGTASSSRLGRVLARFDRGFGAAGAAYARAVQGIVRKLVLGIALYAALLAATWGLLAITPTSFIPQQDKGYLIAFARLPDGASVERTEQALQRLGEIALADPEVDGIVQFAGLSISGFVPQSNFGLAFIRLKPFAERPPPADPSPMPMVARRLNAAFYDGVPDALAAALPLPPVLGLGTTGDFKLYLQDRANLGLPALFAAAQQVMAEAAKDPRLFRVMTYSTLGTPRLRLDIDAAKAYAQGVRLADINEALTAYFGRIYANDFNLFDRTWQVLVSGEAAARAHREDLERAMVRAQDGRLVPLASFVSVHETAGPDRVQTYNAWLALDLNGAPFPGRTGDEAKRAMEEILARALPPGIGWEWTDLTYQQVIAGDAGRWVFPASVLLVFLVLAAFYESLVLPLAIILVVPLSALAGLAGIWIMVFAGQAIPDNSIMTQVGLIVLIGLACKNAILIVEFARDAEVERRQPPLAAIAEACRLRFRPVIMTSIAFILGVLPLLLVSGAGAELRHATGTVVFFGMIGVTLIGLLFTPLFYALLRRLIPRPLAHDDGEAPPAPQRP